MSLQSNGPTISQTAEEMEERFRFIAFINVASTAVRFTSFSLCSFVLRENTKDL